MIRDVKTFLQKYNHTDKEFKTTGFDWNDLLKISDDYDSIKKDLESTGKYLVDRFIAIKKAHSVRFRLKDNEHLIDKLIRKKLDDPNRNLTIETYRKEITDLIGLRILHLFKEDWLLINNYLVSKFDQGEQPTAYLRKGDTEEYVKLFQDNGCEIKYHKYGYRSVHYLIKSNLDKETITSEIQVRTIFEEAWSEIDHTVRYPNNLDNIILEQFLVIFNRLAGSSDEMGSYVIYLKKELDKFSANYAKYEQTISNNAKLIEELRNKVKSLELKEKDFLTISSNLDNIKKSWEGITLPKFEGLKGVESVSLNLKNVFEPLKGFEAVSVNLKNAFKPLKGFEATSVSLKDVFEPLKGSFEIGQTLAKSFQPLQPATLIGGNVSQPLIATVISSDTKGIEMPKNLDKDNTGNDKKKKKKKTKRKPSVKNKK
jgi:putative GTP pyrophosphokinase